MTQEIAADGHRPYTLVAELTYRCPLHCVYCSNPLEHVRHREELDTDTWRRALAEAEALGVVQVNLSGGEPLVRRDLEQLVLAARELDLYTNLITSGVPLTRERLVGLRTLGLDSVQLSMQAADVAVSDRIAGVAAVKQKVRVAGWVKELGLPLTLNVVLHRENLQQTADIVALAETLGADRLELANAQYLGWALANRSALLPAREQISAARRIAADARARLRGRMEVLFVTPDYYSDLPKACMGGWGQRFMVISPTGLVLPCHAAHTLPGLVFENLRDRPLRSIWTSSPGLNAFRGEGWMPEPCRSCERRTIDWGGCRCQAFHLTGNAAATDPACALAPAHGVVKRAREAAEEPARVSALRYRGSGIARAQQA
jgi:pyrroloquinoline quinone biosynthesis protein E